MDKRKDTNNGSGDSNSDDEVTSGVRSSGGCSKLLKIFAPAKIINCFSNPQEGGDGRGGDRNKKGDGGGSGSSCGDGRVGDTEKKDGGGSGSNGGNGSSGCVGPGVEKKNLKDPQDDRNKHRYHSRCENWHTAGCC